MTRNAQFLTIPLSKAQIPFPAYGVGTKWQHLKKGRPEDVRTTLDENLADTVARAIKLGVTHIDTAEAYTTHIEVAEGIKRSGVDRSKIWITDKYNAGFQIPGVIKKYADSKTTYQAIETALKDLDTDYIDLYLLHSQWFDEELSHGNTVEKAWADVEKAYEEGKVKNIGLSNFDRTNLEKVLKVAKHKPQVLQIEFHPYLYNQSPGIIEFAKKNNILVSAYGPLSPLFRASDGPLTPVLKDLAAKYGKSEAQILLRWVYQNGVLPVTTSANDERISSALDTFEGDFVLSDGDVKLITETGATHKFRGFFPIFDESV
jgi:diketogulonate reductase-like aldo/keto reductase